MSNVTDLEMSSPCGNAARSEDTLESRREREQDEDTASGSEMSSDSSNDESEDEDDLRQYISLNLGQTLTSLVLPYRTADRVSRGSYDAPDEENVEGDLSASRLCRVRTRQRSFSQTHLEGRAHVPTQQQNPKRHTLNHGHRRNGFQQLDDIQLNNNFEYGFNPERDFNNIRKLKHKSRPASLYAESNKPLFTGSGLYIDREGGGFDAGDFDGALDGQRKHAAWVSPSLAQNEAESNLEKELNILKRRPSQLMFHPSSSFRNSPRPNICRIRRGMPRRQLSFDSQLTQRASLSLNNGSSSSESCDLVCQSDEQTGGSPKHCHRVDVKKQPSRGDLTSTSSTQNSFVRPRHNLKLDLSNVGCAANSRPVKVAHHPPVERTDKVEVERLVGTDEKDTNPGSDKVKQQGLHDLLNAFKLPYRRTVGRLRRKSLGEKSKSRQTGSATVGSAGDSNGSQYPTCNKSAPSTPECGTLFDSHLSHASSANVISLSTCSLPRVDEGKETFSFDSGLTRKACSSCSIAYGKHGSPVRERETLERRLSDTALQHDKPFGCSPRRALVRRLLSPVVCGSTLEKYSPFGMSSSNSLNSDGSSIQSDDDYQPTSLLGDFNLQDIAEQLCLIDKELIIRIPWKELATCGWMSKKKYACSPNVMNNVEFFNRVAMLVTSCILGEVQTVQRAKLIAKAVKLAKKCRELKNFNSLRAILGGLQCTPIYRLKNTWKQVPSRTKRLFRDLSSLMDNENNFAVYRKELEVCLLEPPCLPFLGDFFTQIAHAVAYSAVRERFEPQFDASQLTAAVNHKRAMNGNVRQVTSQVVTTDQILPDVSDVKSGHSSSSESVGNSTENIALELDGSRKRHSRNDSDDSGVIVLKSACETPEYGDVDPTVAINAEEAPRSSVPEQLQDSLVPSKPDRKRSFQCFDNSGYSAASAGNMQAKEYEFWRYQIAAIQYRVPVKYDVHHFLVNYPFHSEEENYRISLLREKPAKAQAM